MATHGMNNHAPGVYLFEEEVAGPIQGVSTSIAAFVGPASKGPINEPTLITNWTQYQTIFGGFEVCNENGDYLLDKVYTPYAVKGFFENGGTFLKFVRVGSEAISKGIILTKDNGVTSLIIKSTLGMNENTNKFSITKKADGGYTIIISSDKKQLDKKDFSLDTTKPDCIDKLTFAQGVNATFKLVGTPDLDENKGFYLTDLLDGTDKKFDTGTSEKWFINAIDTLKKDEDVTLLCIPDANNNINIQSAMLIHCEQMKNRFAILDTNSNIINNTTAGNGLSSDGGYGAVYYPWVVVSDMNSSSSGQTIDVPPSGHIAGLFARTDSDKGVHKAPANEILKGVLDVKYRHNEAEQGLLNEASINVIRPFTGRGIVVWGARTISRKSQWRYVNVRRLLLYIEESVKRTSMFAVFEPNNTSLWATIKRQISGFLNDVWKNGALVGTTADKAFNVKIDEELNPPDQRELGILNIQIKLYPTTPAEFIVFTIVQKPGGADVQE